jgi:hypothetical protein
VCSSDLGLLDPESKGREGFHPPRPLRCLYSHWPLLIKSGRHRHTDARLPTCFRWSLRADGIIRHVHHSLAFVVVRREAAWCCLSNQQCPHHLDPTAPHALCMGALSVLDCGEITVSVLACVKDDGPRQFITARQPPPEPLGTVLAVWQTSA